MTNQLYKQIPLIGIHNTCSICHKKITTKKVVQVMLYHSPNQTKVTDIEMYYCPCCDLAYCDKQTRLNVRKQYSRYFVAIFIPKKRVTIQQLSDQISKYYQPQFNPSQQATAPNICTKKSFEFNSPFEIVTDSFTIWRTPKKIISYYGKNSDCPSCGSSLETGYTLVPVGNGKKAKVNGLQCIVCDRLYISAVQAVEILLRDNSNAKEFTLNGKYLWSLTEENKRRAEQKKLQERISRLKDLPSSVIMVCVAFKNNIEQDYIIVNENDGSNNNDTVIHYTEEIARELLTAAFVESRKKKGFANGKQFFVKHTVYPKAHNKEISNNVLPKKLNILSGGGYYSGIKNSHKEVVDLLLYSPFTKVYEIAKATYDKINDFCYIDVGIYRRFVRKYGNPGIQLDFESRNGFCSSWNDLQAESILKGYGYSVSQADSLSKQHRHEILSELVDLELLSVPYIIKLLDFFIISHPLPKYDYARQKWNMDKVYIEQYKINTQRFFIAQS